MLKNTAGVCRITFVLAVAAFGFQSTGCGKGGSATATLKMSNTANPGSSLFWNPHPGDTAGLTPSTPTTFKMKLIAAYLAQDIDPTTQNNVGGTSMFYLNPDCANDIMHCDISAGTAEDGAPYSHVVTSFFDFAQTSSQVNAALNAQALSIEAASYKYVRLEFCKVNSGNSNNIQWGDGQNAVKSFKRNSCTVNSAVMSPAITVNAGDSVTVSVAYNYANSISTGAGATGDDTTGSGGTTQGFTLPTFTPSATK
jgi:hypothetical protein